MYHWYWWIFPCFKVIELFVYICEFSRQNSVYSNKLFTHLDVCGVDLVKKFRCLYTFHSYTLNFYNTKSLVWLYILTDNCSHKCIRCLWYKAISLIMICICWTITTKECILEAYVTNLAIYHQWLWMQFSTDVYVINC